MEGHTHPSGVFHFNSNPSVFLGDCLPARNPGAGQILGTLQQVQSWFFWQGGDEIKLVCGYLLQLERKLHSQQQTFIYLYLLPWGSDLDFPLCYL